MKLVKCLTVCAMIGLMATASVQALEPAGHNMQTTGKVTKAIASGVAGAPGEHNPSVFSDDCPATDLGQLLTAGGSFASDMTGMTNVFECTDGACDTYCPWYGAGGVDEIFEFTVEADGLWTFDTGTVAAGWDTSLMLLEGACPGTFITCDDDSGHVDHWESEVTAYLTAGTTYQIVVDDGQYEGIVPTTYTVTYSFMPGCVDDAGCDDGQYCNGVETCNTATYMCEAGTPIVCPEVYQSCDEATDSCVNPDPCLVYEAQVMGTTYFPMDSWSSQGFIPASYGDDWYLQPGLGRDLENYWSLFYMLPSDFTAPYQVNVELHEFAQLCDGDYAVCTEDADCVGHGGTEACLMFNEPGPAIPNTACTVDCAAAGFCVADCSPAGGATLPDMLWYVVTPTDTAGGPIAAEGAATLGASSDIAALYDLTLVGGWATWDAGGATNFLADLCATPVGACCMADFTCSVISEADCDAAGGVWYPSIIGALTDCTDTDTDGVADLCDNCVDDMNADQADCDGDGEGDACEADEADQDMDGDGVCNGVDPCPFDNPDDSDLDGFCDSDDECVLDPMKSVPGQCGCGVGPMAGFDNELDTDGDGYADCIDLCPGIDNDLFPGCDTAIPTVSEWGLVVLALLLLVAGKVYFGRREMC